MQIGPRASQQTLPSTPDRDDQPDLAPPARARAEAPEPILAPSPVARPTGPVSENVDQLMLEVKRQSCLEESDELDELADRIRVNRNMRRRAEKELMRAREARVGVDVDGVLIESFMPDPLEGPTTREVEPTAGAARVVDIDGTELLLPPAVAGVAGVDEALAILATDSPGRIWGAPSVVDDVEPAVREVETEEDVRIWGPNEPEEPEPSPPEEDPYAVARCRSSKNNPTNLTDAPHLKLAIHAIISQGIRKPEAIVQALEEQFGIKATATTVVDDDGRSHVGVDFGNGKIFCDGNGNGALDISDYNFAGALEDVEARFGMTAEVFAEQASEYVQGMLTEMEAAFDSSTAGKEFPKDQLARIFALAFVLSGAEAVPDDGSLRTRAELDDYVAGLEELLANLSADDDTTNEQVQQLLRDQQSRLLEGGDLFHILHDTDNDQSTSGSEGNEAGEASDSSSNTGDLGQLAAGGSQ